MPNWKDIRPEFDSFYERRPTQTTGISKLSPVAVGGALPDGSIEPENLNQSDFPTSITFVIDGGGSAIETGEKGHLEIPFDCEIKEATLLADQSGSIVIDVWKDTYSNFPPDNSDSITASAPPTLSSAQKSNDVTLTGWTLKINKGDILAFNVDSCTDIERVTLSLRVKKV